MLIIYSFDQLPSPRASTTACSWMIEEKRSHNPHHLLSRIHTDTRTPHSHDGALRHRQLWRCCIRPVEIAIERLSSSAGRSN